MWAVETVPHGRLRALETASGVIQGIRREARLRALETASGVIQGTRREARLQALEMASGVIQGTRREARLQTLEMARNIATTSILCDSLQFVSLNRNSHDPSPWIIVATDRNHFDANIDRVSLDWAVGDILLPLRPHNVAVPKIVLDRSPKTLSRSLLSLCTRVVGRVIVSSISAIRIFQLIIVSLAISCTPRNCSIIVLKKSSLVLIRVSPRSSR